MPSEIANNDGFCAPSLTPSTGASHMACKSCTMCPGQYSDLRNDLLMEMGLRPQGSPVDPLDEQVAHQQNANGDWDLATVILVARHLDRGQVFIHSATMCRPPEGTARGPAHHILLMSLHTIGRLLTFLFAWCSPMLRRQLPLQMPFSKQWRQLLIG